MLSTCVIDSLNEKKKIKNQSLMGNSFVLVQLCTYAFSLSYTQIFRNRLACFSTLYHDNLLKFKSCLYFSYYKVSTTRYNCL
ncbi:hypothetical protein VIGAN_10067300 [Vigna angularis var. angularis]|uniref:Uncharacterized protein n=1 Tax=Vigna angularis var. angularis TaxID=157739 RepID=A0A0S3T2G0_PHAAN|nr:hypothetical protein VIGAN_10067300 [Vigna angularis var. angularis]